MFNLRCLPVQPQSFPVVALNHFLKASLFSDPIVRATISPMPLSSGLASIANAFAHSGQSFRGIGCGKIDIGRFCVGAILPPRGVSVGACSVAVVIKILPSLNLDMACWYESASTSTVRVTKIFMGRMECIDQLPIA